MKQSSLAKPFPQLLLLLVLAVAVTGCKGGESGDGGMSSPTTPTAMPVQIGGAWSNSTWTYTRVDGDDCFTLALRQLLHHEFDVTLNADQAGGNITRFGSAFFHAAANTLEYKGTIDAAGNVMLEPSELVQFPNFSCPGDSMALKITSGFITGTATEQQLTLSLHEEYTLSLDGQPVEQLVVEARILGAR